MTKVKVLSWNIDGLDGREQDIRLIAVTAVFDKHQPDVVMLQEVVDSTLILLQNLCKGYTLYQYQKAHYFNVMLVKKDFSSTNQQAIVDFVNSNMGRYMIKLNVTSNAKSFAFITSHLESLKDASKERKNQLKICFDTMLNEGKDKFVIFAGDLNIREQEIKELGIPNTIKDAWIENGSDSNKRFTWNLEKNDNLKMPNGSKPKARYDRMYYRNSEKGNLKLESFQLCGTEKIEACDLFPSDHFGIICSFTLD